MLSVAWCSKASILLACMTATTRIAHRMQEDPAQAALDAQLGLPAKAPKPALDLTLPEKPALPPKETPAMPSPPPTTPVSPVPSPQPSPSPSPVAASPSPPPYWQVNAIYALHGLHAPIPQHL